MVYTQLKNCIGSTNKIKYYNNFEMIIIIVNILDYKRK
jgi:hypothetical protein